MQPQTSGMEIYKQATDCMKLANCDGVFFFFTNNLCSEKNTECPCAIN